MPITSLKPRQESSGLGIANLNGDLRRESRSRVDWECSSPAFLGRRARVVDASLNGLQVETEGPFHLSQNEMLLTVKTREKNFVVRAELAWTRERDDGTHLLGLRLVWRNDESQLRAGRLHRRIDMKIPVWLRGQDGGFDRCNTLNLAVGGALLDLDRSLEVGTRLEVHLDLGDGWEVICDAVVVRARPVFGGRRHATAVKLRPRNRSDRNWLPIWFRQQAALVA